LSPPPLHSFQSSRFFYSPILPLSPSFGAHHPQMLPFLRPCQQQQQFLISTHAQKTPLSPQFTAIVALPADHQQQQQEKKKFLGLLPSSPPPPPPPVARHLPHCPPHLLHRR
jgi:hypothetical protein